MQSLTWADARDIIRLRDIIIDKIHTAEIEIADDKSLAHLTIVPNPQILIKIILTINLKKNSLLDIRVNTYSNATFSGDEEIIETLNITMFELGMPIFHKIQRTCLDLINSCNKLIEESKPTINASKLHAVLKSLDDTDTDE